MLASDEDGAGYNFGRVPKGVSDSAEEGGDGPSSRWVLKQRFDWKAGPQIGVWVVLTDLSAGQDWPQHLLSRTMDRNLVQCSSRFLPMGMTVACLWNEDGHTHDPR